MLVNVTCDSVKSYSISSWLKKLLLSTLLDCPDVTQASDGVGWLHISSVFPVFLIIQEYTGGYCGLGFVLTRIFDNGRGTHANDSLAFQ